MKFSNVIEIDIWSNFGCFSKPFSTTGGLLSYLIPPKTSIVGIIGSILGYDFDDYEENGDIKKYSIENLFKIKVSIQPLFDFKSKRVTFNMVSGNVNKTDIINVHQDVLIKPYYKLFISFPDDLKTEESLFLDRIKNHQTVYNLYMGKNEFPLSYKLCNVFNYDSIFLNKNNIDEFFRHGDVKIYGSLNREFIKDTKLKSFDSTEDEGLIFNFTDNKNFYLKSFYEYVIREYPIKRSNFVDFTFSDISFYSANDLRECYFSKLVLKDNLDENQGIELTKIGENEWISLI